MDCTLETDDELNEISNANTDGIESVEWLGDTGAQCHVKKAKINDKGTSMLTVTMDNNPKVEVLRKENLIVADEIGIEVELKGVRVVKGMATNIISLMQLVDEGWHMSSAQFDGNWIIQMTKNNQRLAFAGR